MQMYIYSCGTSNCKMFKIFFSYHSIIIREPDSQPLISPCGDVGLDLHV